MSDTDVQEQSVADPEGTNSEQVEEEVPAEAKPTKKEPHPCLCGYFEVGKYEDGNEEEVFTTGCQQTTLRQFAQGHDARLVSFLVDGHFDGYTIRFVQGGAVTAFANPGDAARSASDKLGDKAATATINRQVRVEAKAKKAAEREATRAARKAEAEKAKADKAAAKEAAKAQPPKATGAEVAAGSQEGDRPAPPEGKVRVKVGRWEYDATIDDNGTATFVDGKGDTQIVERDGYRLLQPA